jgi:hypothetical protein
VEEEDFKSTSVELFYVKLCRCALLRVYEGSIQAPLRLYSGSIQALLSSIQALLRLYAGSMQALLRL